MKKIFLLISGLMALASLSAQVLKTPYFCGFEDAAENANWTLYNGTNTNRWVIGNAVSNEGRNAAYISNDGSSYAYSATQGTVALSRTFTLQANTRYVIEFDWKGQGTAADGLYICWLPVTYTPEATSTGALPTYVTSYGVSETFTMQRQGLPDTTITQLMSLHGTNTWQHFSFEVTGRTNPYQLVFVWNNGTTAYGTPIAIDNVQIGQKNSCGGKPANLVFDQRTSTITWDGTSATYDLRYKKEGDLYWNTHNGLTTNSDTLTGLSKGIYTAWVRSTCEGDTSTWSVLTNMLVYTSSELCLDYLNLNNRSVVSCRYGNIHNPAQFTGVVDFGSASDKSRHTINFQNNEYDVNTDYGLAIVPAGEIASVRLGNRLTGGEAEMMTFDLRVDSTMCVLLVNYAIVLQNPNHSESEQPRFTLRLFDQSNRQIETLCGAADFITGKNTSAWHVASNGVEWKDWTTMGLNLQNYVGQTIRVEFVTRDCSLGGHYGYAYFTLDCASPTIEGMTCGDGTVEALVATPGFAYEWRRAGTDSVVCTTNRFVPEKNDTSDYVVNLYFLKDDGTRNSDCMFQLFASLKHRWPHASATRQGSWGDCGYNVRFTNTGYVSFDDGSPSGDSFESSWSFGDGSTSNVQNPTHKYTSPGTYPVSLRASIAGGQCFDLWTDTIVVPQFGDTTVTTSVQMCNGQSYTYEGHTYTRDTHIEDQFKTFAGCDSIRIFDLKYTEKIEVSLTDTVCSNSAYRFGNRDLTESGQYVDSLRTVNGCDSIVTLDLVIMNPRDGIVLDTVGSICYGMGSFTFTASVPDICDSIYVQFSDSLKAAGMTDQRQANPKSTATFSIPLPETLHPGTYRLAVRSYNYVCGWMQNDLLFTVNYPASVITQRWNDVLAVTQTAFDQFGSFVSYQWYRNGQPINGENRSYLYASSAGLGDDTYQVAITRADGSQTISCDFIPLTDQPERTSMQLLPSMAAAGSLVAARTDRPAEATLFTQFGLPVASWHVEPGGSTISLPTVAGMYLLRVVSADGQVQQMQKIIVK